MSQKAIKFCSVNSRLSANLFIYLFNVFYNSADSELVRGAPLSWEKSDAEITAVTNWIFFLMNFHYQLMLRSL